MPRNWNDDPFTKKARKENFLARSIYKLEEIEKKHRILHGAETILDLGAAPGSWSQFCLKKCPEAKVIAVDLKPMGFEHPRLKSFCQSIEDVSWKEMLGDNKADVVISDMAPNTSGNADRDCALSHELATIALEAAMDHLKPGGHFVVKYFMGSDFEEYRNELRARFEKVSQQRPDSTRKQSREIFFIAKGLKAEAT